MTANYSKSVTLGNRVTTIGDEAFMFCHRLTNMIIPDSVTSIGERAFSDCSDLASISIPDSLLSLGDQAFLGCTRLTTITVDINNLQFSSTDGILFNKNQTELIYTQEAEMEATRFLLVSFILEL